jgi:lambda family phage minor tail protein L
MSALADVQSLDQGADVFIYIVSNYNSANPSESIKLSNYAGVSFNGPAIGLPITHDSQEVTSVGSQPRMTISIADTNGAVTSLIDGNVEGIEGANVKIYRTKRKYLDDGELGGNPAIGILQQMNLVISRVSEFVPMSVVTVEAQSPIDYGNVACPSRVALNQCPWRYRSSECSYSGTAMFKLDNSPTINPAEDICSKSLAGCRARFGANAVLPHGGFPTLQRR